MESWKPNISNFNQKKPGNVKASAPCKKHPKHSQSPGVCSICLRERLSQLSNTSTSKVATSLSSSSSSSSCSYVSSLSSSNVSSYSSPARNSNSIRPKHWEARKPKPIRAFKNVGQNVLKKSRSMAFVLQRRKEEASIDENNGKNIDNGRGFWSKLLTRRNKGLMHSRTMRERVTTEVH